MGLFTLTLRVHIRRTDKLRKEASYHSLEEYMIQVYIIMLRDFWLYRLLPKIGGKCMPMLCGQCQLNYRCKFA